jgi:hypothetical protein
MTRHGTQQNPNTRPPIALIAANIKTALMPLPQVHAIAPACELAAHCQQGGPATPRQDQARQSSTDDDGLPF